MPMTVRHPVTGDPLMDEKTQEPMTITLVGQDSKEFTASRHRLMTRKLQTKRGFRNVLKAEELDEDAMNLLVAATKAWSGVQFQGKYPECTPENIKQVYEALPWLREQVSEFVSDRANFLGNSSANC